MPAVNFRVILICVGLIGTKDNSTNLPKFRYLIGSIMKDLLVILIVLKLVARVYSYLNLLN
eukprot:SAG31_NODE_904_length_11120_cov_76.575084_2_plen_61_part_00